MSSDTRVVDRVQNANDALDRVPVHPDLAKLVAQKAAVDQQLTHTSAGHPDFAKLTTQQTALASAIKNHPKNAGA